MATARLLTLTGPGGTGKTRLALQLASEVVDEFPDGVFFVPLDAITEPELIPSAVVAALGIEAGSGPPLERVIEHARNRQLLLVLDNFEQVVAGGPLVARVLGEAPRVRAVVTSRILLNVYGEQGFAVPPLGVPETDGRVTAAVAIRSEAVRLFVERAMGALPAFELTDDNAPSVVEIVRRLDGLPLAIELGAARVRLLPVETLRGRLDQRLAVLTGGPRDRPERQQTLRAAIDWSYDLLDEPDRRLFERLAVFAGGGSLAEIEAICGPSSELGREVLDGLDSLIEKSLLRSVPGTGQEPRFAMLATIREYALERLDVRGESETLPRRHALAFLDLVESCAGHLTGEDSRPRLDRLQLDHDNLRAACDWAVATGSVEIALKLGAGLWRFWQIRGHLMEARDRLARALALSGSAQQPAALQAKALGAAGSIDYWRGDFAPAHRHYAAAVEQARSSGDRAILAEALYNLGFVPNADRLGQEERFIGGRPYVEEALELYRELGDLRGQAGGVWALAMAASFGGDLMTGRRLLSESLQLNESLGDRFGSGWALHFLGLIEATEGNLDEADRAFGEALQRFVAADDRSAFVLLLVDYCVTALMRGDLERHWRLAGAATKLREETGTDLVLSPVASLGWRLPGSPSGDPAAERAWAEGRALSLDGAIAYALGRPPG